MLTNPLPPSNPTILSTYQGNHSVKERHIHVLQIEITVYSTMTIF